MQTCIRKVKADLIFIDKCSYFSIQLLDLIQFTLLGFKTLEMSKE